jgi:hypothetical protein
MRVGVDSFGFYAEKSQIVLDVAIRERHIAAGRFSKSNRPIGKIIKTMK